MKILNMPRGTGKTTKLINTSEVTGYPILCSNLFMVDNVKKMAKKMGCDIPEPMTVADFRHKFYQDENVLVDEILANNLLATALNQYIGANVVACTMTLESN